MKLVDLQPESWYRSAPFVDTLLLPVAPVKVEGKLFIEDEKNQIEEICVRTEKQLMGRVLLLPTVHYLPTTAENTERFLEEIITQFGQSDFSYLFLVARSSISNISFRNKIMSNSLQVYWNLLSSIVNHSNQLEEEVENLTSSILTAWSDK
ncbi:DUF2487 family protein [Risungbinella massiliensis]|uniref:DUF2487 family protein n=1 Tax=Risungbinella massiliensis TaxID=1329796 RepID=UPI0011CC3F9C|nr:DUF2487 family protein [Risungbinella massiliensis]